MEKKILETIILSTRDTSELQTDINGCIEGGYQLHDQMIITPFDDERGDKAFLYTQIMAKYKEE